MARLHGDVGGGVGEGGAADRGEEGQEQRAARERLGLGPALLRAAQLGKVEQRHRVGGGGAGESLLVELRRLLGTMLRLQTQRQLRRGARVLRRGRRQRRAQRLQRAHRAAPLLLPQQTERERRVREG